MEDEVQLKFRHFAVSRLAILILYCLRTCRGGSEIWAILECCVTFT
jgi:hypothetical protein